MFDIFALDLDNVNPGDVAVCGDDNTAEIWMLED